MKNSLLIIDDDPGIRAIFSELLSEHFENISYSDTVEDAFLKLANETFSLIILDIDINGRNGAEVILFLRENPGNENNQSPVILASRLINMQFIERNFNRFAGIIMKPFDHSELVDLVKEILIKDDSINDDPKSISADGNEEVVPYLTCAMPFPVPQLDSMVNKMLDQVRKTSKLKNLFKSLKIDRTPGSFAQARIGLIINISVGISAKLDWSSDKTLEKFVYAAYLHDMALAGRADLALISSLEQLESMKSTLSEEDYKLVLDHPNIAANTIEDYKEISTDVVAILRQHHELPYGNGFPAKISYNKITPLATIFIVAMDLAEYILHEPNWKIDKYLLKGREKFKGIHFMKVLEAVKNM